MDFFRNFTVDVVGVGDVCSFAQMDVKRHGNPEVCVQHIRMLHLLRCLISSVACMLCIARYEVSQNYQNSQAALVQTLS